MSIESVQDLKIELECETDDDLFTSIILGSKENDTLVILVRYTCESDLHTFLHWSGSKERRQFNHECAVCDEKDVLCRAISSVSTEEFSTDFKARKDGVVVTCTDCIDRIKESLIECKGSHSKEFAIAGL